jgi:Holliday junction resolvase RusA-like endonuclease
VARREYTFTIPGHPAVKSRPRFGKGRVHGTEKTEIFEAKVSMAAEGAGVEPLEGPVEMYVEFFVKRPKKKSKKKHRDGPIPSDKRPDTDNLVKAIKDGLNGIGYHDDSQVAHLDVVKLYHAKDGKPCTRVTIQEWDWSWFDEDYGD